MTAPMYCAGCESEIAHGDGPHKRWTMTVRLTEIHEPIGVRATRAVCTVTLCETCAGIHRGRVLQLIAAAGRKGMN